MTDVQNVKVNNIRPKYNNLQEWCNDHSNVYIGRKGIVFINKERYPKEDSIWANPFKITSLTNREQVLQEYESYIRKKLDSDKTLIQKLLDLKSKHLGCWCKPEQCHGDILIKLINEYDKNSDSLYKWISTTKKQVIKKSCDKTQLNQNPELVVKKYFLKKREN